MARKKKWRNAAPDTDQPDVAIGDEDESEDVSVETEPGSDAETNEDAPTPVEGDVEIENPGKHAPAPAEAPLPSAMVSAQQSTAPQAHTTFGAPAADGLSEYASVADVVEHWYATTHPRFRMLSTQELQAKKRLIEMLVAYCGEGRPE